jgi:SAM-dependent methyltransferase
MSGDDHARMGERAAAGRLYDEIGQRYSGLRQTEPRIAKLIWAALGDARTVINVGAGGGSYEPPDRDVVAIEPSAVMRAQRPAGSPPCIAARAEALPFPDRSFDAAMAVLSDHHWSDPIAGLREMQRVAKRVVLFQWDNQLVPRFWLVRDYLPEFAAVADERPSLRERAALIGAEMQPVLIPWDCVDGFFYAFWRRPEMYLDERIRRATSVWNRVGPHVEQRVVGELRGDLEWGRWQERNRELLELNEAELGARLLIAER